jgi:hypothetical protein
MPEQAPTTEETYLPTAGPIAGIPGNSHAPGRYLIDWVARTATRIEDTVAAEIAHIAEEIHPAPAEPAASTEQITAPTAAAETAVGEEPAHD